jgi:hypothetical protein
MSAEDAASESAENGGITMAAKKTAADDFDWSLESYDDPDYGEIKEWTYSTGKDEFTIQSYVDEDGFEHFDATSSVNGLLNDSFDGFDSFEEAENACYNAADLDDEKEADDPFATEASAKKAHLDGWEEDEPGTFYKELSNGFEGFVGDATGNGFGYTILNNTDNDLPSNELYSKDGFDSIEEAEAAADAWVASNITASKHEASVKKAHDVSNLDVAISALSDQLALDPDDELADMLSDLVEYRNGEAKETVEDEFEAHGENVPITESAKK